MGGAGLGMILMLVRSKFGWLGVIVVLIGYFVFTRVGPGMQMGAVDSQAAAPANDEQANFVGFVLDDVQARLDRRRESLVAQFTAMEAALSRIQAQGTWLTQQITALNTTTAGMIDSTGQLLKSQSAAPPTAHGWAMSSPIPRCRAFAARTNWVARTTPPRSPTSACCRWCPRNLPAEHLRRTSYIRPN